jgi:hypothetical protein
MDGDWTGSAYRFVYRYSGVAMLLLLLAALPWLPISPAATNAAVPRPTVLRPNTAAGPILPASGPAQSFTVHIVSNDAEVVEMKTRFPDARTDLVFTVLPEEEATFLRWRAEINAVREDVKLPPLILRDHRCDPQAPSPVLCRFDPVAN